MKPTFIAVSLSTLVATGSLGADAVVFNDSVLEAKVEMIASERVEVEQIENVVEAKTTWKGEKGIDIAYDMGEPTLMERLRDKRTEEVIYEKVDFGSGGFKVDVLLNEQPETNVFCYTINNAENYDFFYQPALTDEEIKQGDVRPPEIVGSYAVYHKNKRGNLAGRENYATGKVLHIPRPQVWEMQNKASTTIWADLSYDNGQLCVTVPQEYLDKATYPVRVDPTFGYTSIGASTADGSNIEYAIRYSLSEPGIVTEINLYTMSTVPPNDIKGTLYTSVSDYPNTLLATGNAVAIKASPAWVTSAVPLTQIPAGTYWIGWVMSPSTSRTYYDAGTTNQRYFINGDYTPNNPYTAGGTGTDRMVSIYASYTPINAAKSTINGGRQTINGGRIIHQ